MKMRNLYYDNGIKFKSLAFIPICQVKLIIENRDQCFLVKFELKNQFIGLFKLQFLVFGSFFLTLRILSSNTLSSLHHEGFVWCPDLTTTDPYYILNLITAATLYVILKTGVEFGNVGSFTQATQSSWAHLVQRASIYLIPVGVLFFSFTFPSAICLYWASNNIFSLLQILLLKKKFVQKYLKMPQLDKSAATFERNQPGFVERKLLLF